VPGFLYRGRLPGADQILIAAAKAFFDTNVLIYAVAHDDPRSAQAEELLASGGVLSVQVLNEFASVARRKILMSWSDVTEALDAFRVLCPSPLPITIEMHEAALQIAEKHGCNIYDALVVSAALEAGLAVIWETSFVAQLIHRAVTLFLLRFQQASI
jgi:predicted nucleic acid-binding protein